MLGVTHAEPMCTKMYGTTNESTLEIKLLPGSDDGWDNESGDGKSDYCNMLVIVRCDEVYLDDDQDGSGV